MSQREFEAFEAGRRYANTDWQQDLQGMEGDNLLRELLRTTALLNWQMNDLKEQIRQWVMLSPGSSWHWRHDSITDSVSVNCHRP